MNVLTEWLEQYFDEVTPKQFYRGIFPAGELEKKGEYVQGKYTGIIVAITNKRKQNGKRKVYRYSLTDELDAVDTAVDSDDFCLCSPISYAGKQRTAENARMLYAIAVDVDKIRVEEDEKTGRLIPHGLINLWERHVEAEKRLPKPTYIVSSGSGIHLYYVLDRPIPLYHDLAHELQEFKRELTLKIWHDTIVDIKNSFEVQQEGIYQGFRMPGTITKNGGRVKAFLTGERVSMEYLNSFVDGISKAKKAEKQKKSPKLEEAAKKWPEWYERRIKNKQKRGVWHISRALYDWWLQRIKEGATVGHRYYCMMLLAMFAKKCSYYDEKHNPNPVTREELERDCMNLIDTMEKLTNSEDNHFGEDDALDALEAFDDKWTTYPREAVQYRSGIVIPANKRNYRSQETHLKIARSTLEVLNEEHGKALQGRKSKAEIVKEWRLLHEEGRKIDCIRETGLSKTTVYKHWNAMEEDQEDSTEKLLLDFEESVSKWETIIGTIKSTVITGKEAEMKELLKFAEERKAASGRMAAELLQELNEKRDKNNEE